MSDLPTGQILQGDCREVMKGFPDGSFEAVVTDPPWGIDGGRGHTSVERGKGAYGGEWDDNEQYIGDVVVPIIRECIRVARTVAVTPGNNWLQLYPKAADIGCFWCPGAVGRGPFGFVTHSPILYYGKDPRGARAPSGTVVTEGPSCKEHPCAKPMAAWRWLTERVSNEGELVLDPFMGSGTTAVACVQTGRRFVGIELDPGYCEVARRRVAEALLQPRLDFEKATPPRQEGFEL